MQHFERSWKSKKVHNDDDKDDDDDDDNDDDVEEEIMTTTTDTGWLLESYSLIYDRSQRHLISHFYEKIGMNHI